MKPNFLTSEQGFTYLAALVMVVIMGIMLAAAGRSWQMVMQREREKELLFRGSQLRQAINRWQTPVPGQQPPTQLNDLKDLLKDPRSGGTVRYLRRPYLDPMTGKEFVPIKDPQKGIIGVRSASEEQPLKTAFPEVFKEFKDKTKYSEWEFRYQPNLVVSPPVFIDIEGG